jgi:glutaredoxin 3
MMNKFKKNIVILGLAFFSLLFIYIASIYDNNHDSPKMKNIKWLKMTDNIENTKVVIYTKPTCGYCIRAKNFFKDTGIKYVEIDVSTNQILHQELIEKTGSKTVPLIFINDEYIGGCSDMLKMAEDGRLERLFEK